MVPNKRQSQELNNVVFVVVVVVKMNRCCDFTKWLTLFYLQSLSTQNVLVNFFQSFGVVVVGGSERSRNSLVQS